MKIKKLLFKRFLLVLLLFGNALLFCADSVRVETRMIAGCIPVHFSPGIRYRPYLELKEFKKFDRVYSLGWPPLFMYHNKNDSGSWDPAYFQKITFFQDVLKEYAFNKEGVAIVLDASKESHHKMAEAFVSFWISTLFEQPKVAAFVFDEEVLTEMHAATVRQYTQLKRDQAPAIKAAVLCLYKKYTLPFDLGRHLLLYEPEAERFRFLKERIEHTLE